MIVAGIEPPAEMVHWWFATGFLVLGLLLLCEAVVGEEVWSRRPWRRYLWPGLVLAMGVCMFPVMTFFTNSTIHMIAHGSWAQVMMLTGGAELGVATGKLRSRYWRLCSSLALALSGGALLVHEQNAWLFARAAFLHHVEGWFVIAVAPFPAIQAFRPRSLTAALGFASTFVILAVLLFCDRDTASIFGHLSYYAGVPHR